MIIVWCGPQEDEFRFLADQLQQPCQTKLWPTTFSGNGCPSASAGQIMAGCITMKTRTQTTWPNGKINAGETEISYIAMLLKFPISKIGETHAPLCFSICLHYCNGLHLAWSLWLVTLCQGINLFIVTCLCPALNNTSDIRSWLELLVNIVYWKMSIV